MITIQCIGYSIITIATARVIWYVINLITPKNKKNGNKN